MSVGNQRLRGITTLIVSSCTILLLCGCLFGDWELYVQSFSPDGSTEVTVWTRGIGVHSEFERFLSIRIKDGDGERTIGTDKEDFNPGLAEVYWAADSPLVGVMVCNVISRVPVIVAYDTAVNAHVSPGLVLRGLRENILQRYELDPQVMSRNLHDPLMWACTGREDFGTAWNRFKTLVATSHVLPDPPAHNDQ